MTSDEVSRDRDRTSIANNVFSERSQVAGSRWDMYPALPEVVGSLLDVGCGLGQGFTELRGSGTRVVGLDYDAATVAEAGPFLDSVYQLDLARDLGRRNCLNHST
jgi:SAM-dependent methyltransferase